MLEKNKLYNKISSNANLKSSVDKCVEEANLYLQKYSKNFPTYTDHSIKHTSIVAQNASDILTVEDIVHLNEDEAYILLLACFLHDIGMCISDKEIDELEKSEEFQKIKENNSHYTKEDYLRDIHHVKSEEFINKEWEKLKIENERYAKAIGLIAKAHRKVRLDNFTEYEPKFYVQSSGTEFVCLPYLGCIIRLADEMDITNMRTPDLLYKYHLPDNEKSAEEWEKHRAVMGVNIDDNKIIIRGETKSPVIYNALKRLSEKIENVVKESQKIIKLMPALNREFKLKINSIDNQIKPVEFIPKNIGFSFDFDNIFETFIGKNLYNSDDVAIREVIQNAIDSCRYKQKLEKNYKPQITVELTDDKLIVSDNGMGMDEFIIRNYFAKLCSSYYRTPDVSDKYDAIGMFGVGVFSYFLIADYFDVETKMYNKSAQKFRVTKDAHNDFYFYDNFNKETTGTNVIIHLVKKYDIEDLIEYVEQTFYFLEIPLVIIYDNTHFESKFWKKNLPNFEDLKEAYLSSSDWLKRDKIKIISFFFETENVEGYLFTYYNASENKNISLKQYDDNIEVYNKCVYVELIPSVIFSCFISGKINYKSDYGISLSRNTHNNQSYGHIDNLLFIDIELLFLEQIKEELYKNGKNETFKMLRNIINLDFQYGHRIINDGIKNYVYQKLTKEVLFQKYLNNTENQPISIIEIEGLNEYLLVQEQEYDVNPRKADFIDNVFIYFNKNLIIDIDGYIRRFKQNAFNKIFVIEYELILLYDNTNKNDTNNINILYKSKRYRTLYETDLFENLDVFAVNDYFNLKNSKYGVIKKYRNSENKQIQALVESVLDSYADYYESFEEKLIEMNKTLSEFNKETGEIIQLTKDDFRGISLDK